VKTLSKRERVIKTLAHQEPDLVPIDIGSTASWFTESIYEKLKTHLNIKSSGELFRLGENAAIYNDELVERLDTDFMHVYLKPSSADQAAWDAMDGDSFVDEWGIKRQKIKLATGGHNWEKVSYPLKDACIDDLYDYPWPDPSDPARVAGLAERARRLHAETDFALSARAVSHGLFEMAWELRGMETLMYNMFDDKPFVHKLIAKILEVQKGLYAAMLNAVGPWVQVVQTADDYGAQDAPLFSPRMYREFIQPYRRELNQLIKSKAPQAKIQHHTCGSVYKLLPDLIDTGIDILNPVQPLAKDMDPSKLKAEFGDKLTFHGAIDIQEAMAGSLDDVRAEVKTRIRQLGPGGGYIMATCSNVQSDSSPEHVMAMITAGRSHGRYPLV
jgi:uroporphyrinogen decarboxylase